MRGVLLATIVFAALPFVDSASAADMPVKALHAAPPESAWSWTGLYGGFNLGYSVARNSGGFENHVLAGVFSPTDERFNYSPAGTTVTPAHFAQSAFSVRCHKLEHNCMATGCSCVW